MNFQNFIDRIKLPFRKEKEFYLAVYRIFGFYPHNIDLYKRALMHSSVRHKGKNGRPENNERLEFLGDAVLDAVVGHIVFDHFQGKREGFLTNTRSKLVQRATLGKLAEQMELNALILSAGNSHSHNSYMGGNAFEAIIGAAYLDRGYDKIMDFMQNKIFKQYLNLDKMAKKEVNFKSKLLEWCQRNKVKLSYELLNQGREQSSDSPVFEYQVVIETVACGRGKGYTKKESQQNASKEALQLLRKQPKHVNQIFEAKSQRTKMEEMPLMEVVPDITQDNSPLIHNNTMRAVENSWSPEMETPSRKPRKQEENHAEEFDLSDISLKVKSREEIVAEAEAAAFAPRNN